MGALVWECDVLIPGMLQRLNLRFSPPETHKVGNADDDFGGVVEMAELQREFQVFKKGRSLAMSVKVLGLAGSESARARNRWLTLLDSLPNQDKIVAAIVDNLASTKPRPMHFRAVPYTSTFEATINDRGRDPVPWDNTNDYIVVSIPMKPKTAPTP
jgi:hypothetical protein